MNGNSGAVPKLASPRITPPRFRRFAELQDLPPEPDWLWRGFLAPGTLTMLAGQPFAGKSMLVAGLMRALDEGEPFLGCATPRASAVMVSEEDDIVIRQRAGLFGLFGSSSEFLGRSESMLLDWPDLISAAVERAVTGGHRLLVVDTFPGLANLEDEQENDAGAITQRLRPLQQAAAKDLAVLFLHHMNSQFQPRGSKAFRGVVDVSVRLLRGPSAKSTLRLESESRFPEATPANLKAELVKAPDGWFYKANDVTSEGVAAIQAGSSDDRLWQALVDTQRECLAYRDFDLIEGLSMDIAKKRLPGWLDTKVGRRGSGTKNDPYCWYPIAA